jgi:hypothetical protein
MFPTGKVISIARHCDVDHTLLNNGRHESVSSAFRETNLVVVRQKQGEVKIENRAFWEKFGEIERNTPGKGLMGQKKTKISLGILTTTGIQSSQPGKNRENRMSSGIERDVEANGETGCLADDESRVIEKWNFGILENLDFGKIGVDDWDPGTPGMGPTTTIFTKFLFLFVFSFFAQQGGAFAPPHTTLTH